MQSLMPVTSMPACWIERMAVSRPEPALDLNVDLANAVLHGGTGGFSAPSGPRMSDLREPLKPTLPADAQAITSPR